MASSNRVQLVSVVESTLGTTPGSPRMRKRRFTGETLRYTPTYVESEEVLDDGMVGDEINTGTDSNGPINFELHYPFPDSPGDVDIRSALRNAWTNTPTRDNDGTADSVITAVTASSDTYTVTSGAAFVEGHLVRATGFTNAGNNLIFRAQSGSNATSVVAPAAPGLTDETAPPGAARLKVVGFQGASGDITATASGLASTALDFTTLGLLPGMWMKVGGAAAGDRFTNVAANNGWARVSGPVTANAIPLDHRPTGWNTDNGSGKTIKVWVPDQIINGTTTLGQTFEKGFLSQGTPTYIVQRGMVATEYNLTFEAKQKINGTVTYMGMLGVQGTSALDASPDAALPRATYPVFAGSANVGQVSEGGAQLAAPNFCRRVYFTAQWPNTSAVDDVSQVGPADIVQHSMNLTGQTETKFGDNSLLTKFFNGTPTSKNIRLTKGSQALIYQLPRITYNADGSPSAGGRNQLVNVTFGWRASKDEALTNAMIVINRFEYFEL